MSFCLGLLLWLLVPALTDVQASCVVYPVNLHMHFLQTFTEVRLTESRVIFSSKECLIILKFANS